jgi:hypothetical protein
MLKLAAEWGKVERLLPKVEMPSGENHRERVLSADEERRYLSAASAQSYLLRDVTTILPRLRTTPRGMLPNALRGCPGWRTSPRQDGDRTPNDPNDATHRCTVRHAAHPTAFQVHGAFAKSESATLAFQNTERDVFSHFARFIELIWGLSPGLLLDLLPAQHQPHIDELRLFRDEYELLRDFYIQTFETSSSDGSLAR